MTVSVKVMAVELGPYKGRYRWITFAGSPEEGPSNLRAEESSFHGNLESTPSSAVSPTHAPCSALLRHREEREIQFRF